MFSSFRAVCLRFKVPALAALGAICLDGCTTDPEERAFFYSGWMHPETDAQLERRTHEALINSSHSQYRKDPLLEE